MSLLKLDGINTYYGQIHILQDLNLEVNAGELVCLLGGNASGKSTTLKTILGIVRSRTGTITFADEDVTTRTTSHRISRGLAIVPENRRLFGADDRAGESRARRLSARRGREGGLRAGLHALSRSATTGAGSSPERSPAASSRWWRWRGR